MAWISVHQEVDGPKLRKLYRAIGCSKFEALGILNFVWFWGMTNADESGIVREADLDVLARYLYGCGDGSSVDTKVAAQALVDTGWIEPVGNDLKLHDWDVWQEQWYKYQRTKAYNAERKRQERKAEKEKRQQEKKPAEEPKPEQPEAGEPKKPAKKAPEKKKYADFVKMTEAEYEKLVSQYGMEFADACIETLSNYKGAKGKTYKSDYLAILNWVVDRVREKQPALLKRSKAASSSENPFEGWGDDGG